jgi:hypothetical protein
MKPSSPTSAIFRFISIMIILSFLASCSSLGVVESPADVPADKIDGMSEEIVIPKHIGFIFDPEGQGIPYALVGGTEITAEDGVISGDFSAFDGQWIPAEAPGFATSYGQPLVPRDEGFFFDVTLTPYQQMGGLEEEAFLTDSLEGDFSLTLSLSQELIDEPDAVVGLTALELMFVVPSRVAHRSSEGLRLRAAFAVQAFSGLWDPVQLADGAVLPLTIEFTSPLGEEAVFATFDPVQGKWKEQDAGCTSSDSLVYTCQLPMLDPLWAVFDLKDNFMTAGLSSHTTGLAAPVLQEPDGLLNSFNQAYNAWKNFMIDNLDNGTFSFSDPALLKLLSDLEEAAFNYAQEHRTEGAKLVLVRARDAADWCGNEEMADDLFDETGEISEEIAEDLLKDVSCGEYKKLLNGVAQLYLTSNNDALEEQVIEKLKEITGDCDIWTGWISVTMITTRNHPADLPLSGRGGSWWREYHTVKLFTNVKTFELHGESRVRHIFSPIHYVKSNPCKLEIIISGRAGKPTIDYEGRYDGVDFTIFRGVPQGEAGFITQVWDFYDKDENDTCQLTYHNVFFFENYYSQILHGITSDSPQIDLHEMLNSGERFMSGDVEYISGNETLINPEPEMGVFPFHTGDINWKFRHTQKGLPIESK